MCIIKALIYLHNYNIAHLVSVSDCYSYMGCKQMRLPALLICSCTSCQ